MTQTEGTTESSREVVMRLIEADPSIRAVDIARRLGISRARVSQLLDSLEYDQVWRKRRSEPRAEV